MIMDTAVEDRLPGEREHVLRVSGVLPSPGAVLPGPGALLPNHFRTAPDALPGCSLEPRLKENE